MKEIGGYFQLDEFIKRPFYKNIIQLNTGRNALLYLAIAINIKKIYLPYMLCNSVSDMLDRHSIKYEYYHIGKDFLPIFNKELEVNQYLYIVNYYGQIDNKVIGKYKEIYKRIIIDNTQSFFQEPVTGVNTIYSIRKYFGVPDGAYLATDSVLDKELEQDISSERMVHVLGRFEGTASEHYSEFLNNDEAIKSLPLKYMSELTKNILGAIDYEKVVESRNRNFGYLQDILEQTNILKIKKPCGAFAYPYYVENGIEIRKRLAEKKIYIPTLWPNILKNNDINSIEYGFAANILPLPCDQRYNIDDMKIVIKELKSCID